MLKVVKGEMAMMAKLLLSHKYLLHMSRALIYKMHLTGVMIPRNGMALGSV